MDKYGGFLFVIDEEKRAYAIEERILSSGLFTDAISALDWKPKETEIAFISLGEESIQHACLVRRGNKVLTLKYRVKFSNFVNFEPAIPIDQIQGQLQPKIRPHFIWSSSGTGARVPPVTWREIWSVVKRLRPENASNLDRLEELRQPKPDLSSKQGFEIVAQERDAVNLALRISGFDHAQFLDWNSADGELAPFLQGLQGVTLIEDQMIAHDAGVFGDWTNLKGNMVGAVEFRSGDKRLTVMNVNRLKVEQTLGVDLLYYFHEFESYIMVQYKRMTKENGESGYRPIDKSYRSEIKRMQNYESHFRQIEEHHSSTRDYRLHSGVFYFKLCPKDIFDSTSTAMIKGMYIPLDYWNILTNSSAIAGPKGGKCITFKNVGRYFDNTFFFELAKAGWIGSKVTSRDTITKIIQDSIKDKKSVILAATHPNS